MSNVRPLKIIDGVNIGWTVLGKILIYCIIAVSNCPYGLFGRLNFKLDDEIRHLLSEHIFLTSVYVDIGLLFDTEYLVDREIMWHL